MRPSQRPIPWLAAGESFPALETSWGPSDPAPGLLAAGAALDVPTLLEAYASGIFPWFSEGQPTLWWSPDPRMVLQVADFQLHRSLKKTLMRFAGDAGSSIRFDTAFEEVIGACSSMPREGQAGTWILPEMIQAYTQLHRAGHAHSVETWQDGRLAGGLYCVNLGGMVFGESMFARQTDASKIALAGLVAFCRAHGMDMIDCQQNTRHLASLGAAEMDRTVFAAHVATRVMRPAPRWEFKPVYWTQILADPTTKPT
jgi:leucyl/phenylalanyl-tRNA---protein transferase